MRGTNRQTVLDVDAWTIAHAKELLAGNDPDSQEITDILRATMGITDAANITEQHVAAIADMFAASFEPYPSFAEDCPSSIRREFISEALTNPEFQALRGHTVLDIEAAEIGAANLAKTYMAVLRERAKEKAEARQQGAKPAKNRATEKQREQGENEQKDKHTAKAKRHFQLTAHIAQAARSIRQEVKQLQAAKQAFGNSHRVNFRRLDSARLRDIADAAGRFQARLKSTRLRNPQHGYDDMVDLVLNGDVKRMVYSEWSYLASQEEILELLLWQKLLEHKALCTYYEEIPQEKGPVIVVVDESGSMMARGNLEQAKGLALAIAKYVHNTGRWCALLGFSGRGQWRPLVVPVGSWDANALMDWCEEAFGGGTSAYTMVQGIIQLYDEYKSAHEDRCDVIVISDAEFESELAFLQFQDWKKTKEIRAFLLLLGATCPRKVAAAFDVVYEKATLDIGGETDAVLLEVAQ